MKKLTIVIMAIAIFLAVFGTARTATAETGMACAGGCEQYEFNTDVRVSELVDLLGEPSFSGEKSAIWWTDDGRLECLAGFNGEDVVLLLIFVDLE